MGTVVFFKGKSQYNVIRVHLDKDAALLRERGHTVDIVDDFRDPDLMSRLERADLIVGYQGWGWDLRLSDGRPALTVLQTPYLAFLGDHPAYHLARIANMAPHHHVIVCSEANARFAQDFLNVPGSVYLGLPTFNAPPAFTWEGRDVDILVAGSIGPAEEILRTPGLDETGRKAIKDGYRIWRFEHFGRTDTVFLFLSTVGAPILERKGLDYTLQVATLFDQYCRRSYRLEVVRKLRDFPVTLVGSGWRKLCKGLGKNFRFIDTLGYDKYHALLQRTKITINNVAPHFDFHERIADGAANGAAVITNRTPVVSEAFTFGKELIALPGLDDDIRNALAPTLSDPDSAAPIAEAGAARMRSQFCEEQRISGYLELLSTGTMTEGPTYRRIPARGPTEEAA
ncbi:MAG: glycosyltransferase [Alphaproteobacteria bacterium]